MQNAHKRSEHLFALAMAATIACNKHLNDV